MSTRALMFIEYYTQLINVKFVNHQKIHLGTTLIVYVNCLFLLEIQLITNFNRVLQISSENSKHILPTFHICLFVKTRSICS